MIGNTLSSSSHFPVACDPVSRPQEANYSGVNSWFSTSTLVTQWPYGEEITNQTQDDQLHKHTGHELDFESNLDYMHARYYSPFQGWWDLAKNLTIGQTETNAYQITQEILAGSNSSMSFKGEHDEPVQLGRALSTQREIDQAISKILKGPLYKDNLKNRQFPVWNIPPPK